MVPWIAIAGALVRLVGPAADAGTVQWEAPPGCPDQAQMIERIEAGGGVGDLVVIGDVRQTALGAWEVTLSIELHAERDTRVLRGDSCEAVAQAAELLVAVRRDQLDPERPSPPHVPEVEQGPETSPAPVSPTPEPRAPARADPGEPIPAAESAAAPAVRPSPEPPTRPTGLLLSAAAGAGIGATPAPDVPVELAVGASWPRVRLAVRGRWYAPRRVALAEEHEARVQLGTAGVEACARPAVRRLEVPVCGQVAIGGSRADGGGPRIRDREGVWAEAGLDVALAWHLRPWWALTARVGGAVVLTGTRYVRADEVVFDPAPIHGRVVLGVEFHVPIQIGARAEKD
ncbi:MAG: hypothetical protein KDK70_07090 [Myxococcales bacterium]|nr:hypothetical protein [Myxococcales bacterium]